MPSRPEVSLTRSSRTIPRCSGRITAATSSSTWSWALASAPSARSSVRSTWKRANGTARSSSARIRSAPPSSPTMSAGSAPDGSGTTRSSSRLGSAEAARAAAVWPAASASRQSRIERREVAELGGLLGGQRRPHRRHRVGEARLVQRDHVGVALGEDHRAGLGGGGARDVDAEQLAALGEDLALARVDVLRPLAVAHRPRPEPAHAPAAVGEREHDLAAEDVVDPPLAPADRQPGGEDLLVRVARPPRGVRAPCPRRSASTPPGTGAARPRSARGRAGTRARRRPRSDSHSTRT